MLNIPAAKAIPPRMVILAGGLVALAIVLITAVALWFYREAELASGEWHLKNIAVALAEQTRQGMLTIDIALRATADDYRDREKAARRLSDEALHLRLSRRVSELPQLRSLLVIRGDGGLVVHSEGFPAPHFNYSDRDYFAVHRDGKEPALFVGAPVKGHVTPGWIHTLSRRLSGPQDEFLGVVSATVDIAYFHDIYRALELGPQGRLFLFRNDGVLVTSYPEANAAIGRSFSSHALFAPAAPGAASGVLRATGLLDEIPRLIAYRSVREYPLVVAVASTQDYVLRAWRMESLYAAASAVGAACVILLATLLLARQLRVSQELAGEVAKSELRWRAALEAAGHGVWDFDVPSGRVFCSKRYREILGDPAREATLSRADWVMELDPEDRAAFGRGLERCLTGERPGCSAEVRFNRPDGSSTWGLIRGMVVSCDAQGRVQRIAGTVTDVTDERLAQQRLRESEARLNGIIGSAMDAIITIDENHNIVLFNAAAEKIFRCPAREAVGGPLERFVPQRFRAAHGGHISRFGATGTTVRRMGGDVVLAGLRAGGEEFPIDASISQVEVGGYRFYTVILRDITERQRAAEALAQSHRQLRELYAAMHEVREAERARIARELHDELAQWLTALKMDVSWVAARLPRELQPLAEKTDKMKAVVDTTVAAVRRIAADLRPVMIDDLGLVPAIEHLLHEFSERSGVLVSLEADAERVEFREPLATALYRMVQEALTNVARHAAAARVEVSIACEDDKLVVRVRDDGKGIGAGPPKQGKSLGLLGIQERAETLGGMARFYSLAAGGTVVEIVIPLHAYQSGEAAA